MRRAARAFPRHALQRDRAFFNQTLPSANRRRCGPLWLVARAAPDGARATYSIFVDRAIGLVALAILIVASLPWSYELITGSRTDARRCCWSTSPRSRAASASWSSRAEMAVAEDLVGHPSHPRLRRDRNRVIFDASAGPSSRSCRCSFTCSPSSSAGAWCSRSRRRSALARSSSCFRRSC